MNKKVQLFVVVPFGPKHAMEGIFSNPEDAVKCAANDIADAMEVRRIFVDFEIARKLVRNAAILEGTHNKVFYKVHPDLMPTADEVMLEAADQKKREDEFQAGQKAAKEGFKNKPRIIDTGRDSSHDN